MELLSFLIFICIVICTKIRKYKRNQKERLAIKMQKSFEELQADSGYIDEYEKIIEKIFKKGHAIYDTIVNSDLPESEKALVLDFLYKEYPKELEREQLGLLIYKDVIAKVLGGIAFAIMASLFIINETWEISSIYKIIIAVGVNVLVKGITSFILEYCSLKKLNPEMFVNQQNLDKHEKVGIVDYFCNVMESLLLNK